MFFQALYLINVAKSDMINKNNKILITFLKFQHGERGVYFSKTTGILIFKVNVFNIQRDNVFILIGIKLRTIPISKAGFIIELKTIEEFEPNNSFSL